MKTIRASEIGSFLFCRRAWWYQKQGVSPENKRELAGGSAYHYRHGRRVIHAGLLRAAGWAILILSLLLLVIGLTLQFLA